MNRVETDSPFTSQTTTKFSSQSHRYLNGFACVDCYSDAWAALHPWCSCNLCNFCEHYFISLHSSEEARTIIYVNCERTRNLRKWLSELWGVYVWESAGWLFCYVAQNTGACEGRGRTTGDESAFDITTEFMRLLSVTAVMPDNNCKSFIVDIYVLWKHPVLLFIHSKENR